MSPKKSGLIWLLPVLVTALFFLVYPLYVIRPFRHQGPQELQAALFVLHWQHIVEIICAAAGLCALFLLRRTRFQPRPAAYTLLTMFGTALLLICAALSFVNVFEIMFHPAGAPTFQSVRETRLDGAEKLLAVNTHAYPIRVISYHHIVNDTEDGVPIAVTY